MSTASIVQGCDWKVVIGASSPSHDCWTMTAQECNFAHHWLHLSNLSTLIQKRATCLPHLIYCCKVWTENFEIQTDFFAGSKSCRSSSNFERTLFHIWFLLVRNGRRWDKSHTFFLSYKGFHQFSLVNEWKGRTERVPLQRIILKWRQVKKVCERWVAM